jgi:hypothetical protein
MRQTGVGPLHLIAKGQWTGQFAVISSKHLLAGICVTLLVAWAGAGWAAPPKDQSPAGPQTPPSQPKPATPPAPTRSPVARGTRLILKDGTYQVVRSYARKGERVRYYSVERSAWEEIPVAMVDWSATAAAEAEQKRDSEELARKIHVEEESNKLEVAMDVDASLQVAPGVFLPPGEGMFVVDGRSVTPLQQVDTQLKTDKKQTLKQIIVPVPVVSGKRNLEIEGAKAKLRITSAQPEFYLREAPPDPDRISPVRKSSRPGESGPEVELIRAVVKGNKRRVESIRSLMGQELSQDRNTISIERWDLAPTVFRFTLSQKLEPGEYVLAEILRNGMNLYVWEFGVDAPAQRPAH